ncbi:MAG: hypothetical protein ACRDQ0_21575 [Pseudonocardia sp.]
MEVVVWIGLAALLALAATIGATRPDDGGSGPASPAGRTNGTLAR